MKRAKRYLTAEGDAAARQDGGDAGLRLGEMTALERSDEVRDIGIYYWTRRALDVLETAIRKAPIGTAPVPIPGDPEFLDTANYKRRCGRELRRKAMTTIARTAEVRVRKQPVHVLRHTFASLLIQNRESLVYVPDQMGHSSIPGDGRHLWPSDSRREPERGRSARRRRIHPQPRRNRRRACRGGRWR
jgi:integrase